MTIPSTATSLGDTMDPKEELDYAIDISGLLEAGEAVATWSVALLSEGPALGLAIMTGSGRDPSYNSSTKKIALWFKVSAGFQSSAIYDAGAVFGMEVTLVTDAVPARTRQRTVTLGVKQL